MEQMFISPRELEPSAARARASELCGREPLFQDWAVGFESTITARASEIMMLNIESEQHSVCHAHAMALNHKLTAHPSQRDRRPYDATLNLRTAARSTQPFTRTIAPLLQSPEDTDLAKRPFFFPLSLSALCAPALDRNLSVYYQTSSNSLKRDLEVRNWSNKAQLVAAHLIARWCLLGHNDAAGISRGANTRRRALSAAARAVEIPEVQSFQPSLYYQCALEDTALSKKLLNYRCKVLTAHHGPCAKDMGRLHLLKDERIRKETKKDCTTQAFRTKTTEVMD
ncbi:hypothetical protein DFH06DRAFT_1153344 [Mycena polygramma]|nr:hypothetical protein DFH06DRAFT_1153344 [Mycena polygramma]